MKFVRNGSLLSLHTGAWYEVLGGIRSLRFGHGCAVHVGVDVGAGDVEVDVIYITFIMSAQYTGYLVPYKDKVQPGKYTSELTCTDIGA